MFAAALFTIAKQQNSQDAPLPTNGLNKCSIYTMEFYSATKKKAILSFTGKWMYLENINLSMLARLRRRKITFSLICGSLAIKQM
jgi:hypothetical protein